MITGNITVAFAALSYAGSLNVTVIADPELCPDLPDIVQALQRELDVLTAAGDTESSRRSRDFMPSNSARPETRMSRRT